MENTKLNLVALAALLHDVGKLLERGEVLSEARKDATYLGWCPQGQGFPTHLHAAHTAAFCDWLEERFTCLKLNNDRSWKGWCAGHHRNDEMGLEASVIRIADRLSSKERDEGQYYQREIHRKTLLEPVVERVFLAENHEMLATKYRYPLMRFTSRRGDMFPKKGNDLGLEEMKNADGPVGEPAQWRHLMAKAPLVKDYKELCKGLMDEIDVLSQKWPDLDLSQLLVTLVSLLERYTANVPSATNIRHPDISLFDHMCTTASIAQALYIFQNGLERPEIGLQSMDDAKWLLVCGDFSGIQKFIYNLTNKGAAKGLRGRSFYVQHFCKICGEFILRELGLTRLALLYNSGGKFYLLLPSNLKSQCLDARKKVNAWLMEKFSGQVFFGIGMAPVTAAMFEQGAMDSAWKLAAEDLEKDRMTKFREFFMPEFFEPQTDFDPTESCSVCGSRRKAKSKDKCQSCHDFEDLGAGLRDAGAILVVWKTGRESHIIQEALHLKRSKALSFPDFDVDCFLVPDRMVNAFSAVKHIDGECIFLNDKGDLPFSDLQLPGCAISSMYLGKWNDPKPSDGEVVSWDFDDFAKNARGIGRLGILRMDVDNLGMIFIRGLRFPRRKSINVQGKNREGWGDVIREESGSLQRKTMASISRMVTLSRRLGNFFSGYIPQLLTQPEFDRCRIIYAGGDDLFVIGSWDQLPDLAKTVHKEFKDFCCGNPDCTISGGIFLQRGKYPLYKGAQLAGQAEKAAKNLRENRKIALHPSHKNAFCFLDVPVVWEDLEIAEAIKGMLEAEIEKNKGIMAFLSQMTAKNKVLVDLIAEEKNIGKRALAWKEIEYYSWRWRTAYQLRRRYGNMKEREVWADALFANKNNGKEACLPVYSWLELPLRWTDYLHRDKGGK